MFARPCPASAAGLRLCLFTDLSQTQLPVDPTNFRSNHFVWWCQVSLWGLQWNFLVFDWISCHCYSECDGMVSRAPALYDPMWENIWYIDIRLLAVPRSTKIMKEITPGGRLFVKPLGFNDLFDLFLKTQTIGIHQRGSATTHAAQSRSRSYWGWGEVSEFLDQTHGYCRLFCRRAMSPLRKYLYITLTRSWCHMFPGGAHDKWEIGFHGCQHLNHRDPNHIQPCSETWKWNSWSEIRSC